MKRNTTFGVLVVED